MATSRPIPEDRVHFEEFQASRGVPHPNYAQDRSNDLRSPRLPFASSPQGQHATRTMNNSAPSPQIRSNSPALVNRGPPSTASSGARIIEQTRENIRYPLAFNHLRHDDSMTYVAVTASGSSPQSDFDDDLSEGSHYTDREALGNLDASSWAGERKPPNGTRAIERRDALLTGLGLKNVEGSQPVVDSTNGDERVRRGYSDIKTDSFDDQQREGQIGYAVMDDGYLPNERDDLHLKRSSAERYAPGPTFDEKPSNSQSVAKHVSDIPSRRSSSRLETPRQNISASDEQQPLQTAWGSPNDPRHDNNLNADQVVEQVSRSDARRNTWVYDEARLDPFPPAKGHQDTRRTKPRREERSDSASIVWSDNDNLEEPLSEDAQRMFDRLQQENVSNEAQGGKNAPEEYYYDPRDHTPASEKPSSHATEVQRQETPTSIRDEPLQAETGGVRTWRRTISSSAYQSLLKKHGIIEMKRQDVIFELCETEAAFVKSMKLVIRLFVEPLRSRGMCNQSLCTDNL